MHFWVLEMEVGIYLYFVKRPLFLVCLFVFVFNLWSINVH